MLTRCGSHRADAACAPADSTRAAAWASGEAGSSLAQLGALKAEARVALERVTSERDGAQTEVARAAEAREASERSHMEEMQAALSARERAAAFRGSRFPARTRASWCPGAHRRRRLLFTPPPAQRNTHLQFACVFCAVPSMAPRKTHLQFADVFC